MNRPTHNPGAVLTARQTALVVAGLLTDAWLEMRKGGTNPRVGLQQCERNKELILWWKEELKDLILQENLSPLMRKGPDSKKATQQWLVKTVSHPQFLPFILAFGGHGKDKTVPKVSYLKEHLTYEALAVILMMDGSSKSKHSKAMEIHTQGFEGLAPHVRLCIALYEALGIKAFPTIYGINQAKTKVQYHICIAGCSLPLIHLRVLPFILDDFKYKVPELGTRSSDFNESQSPWNAFYSQYKGHLCLEDLSIVV